MDFNIIDPSDTLLAGAGPMIRKIVQAIIDKYPGLFDWATPLSFIVAFLVIVGVDVMPDQIELYIKGAIALAGVTSVYNDYRMGKKAETIKDQAIAKESGIVLTDAIES